MQERRQKDTNKFDYFDPRKGLIVGGLSWSTL